MTFFVFALTPFVAIYIIYKIICFVIGLVRAITSDTVEGFDEPDNTKNMPATRIFKVQCPHCRKSITITGNTKMATCDYCGNDFQIDWTEESEDDDDDDESMNNVIPLAAYFGNKNI